MFVADPRAAYERALAAALAVIGASVCLGFALTLEHGFGVRPCHLCLVERWPYYAGIPLCCVALGTAHRGRFPAEAALGLACAAFLAGLALAAYHAGVEHGTWQGPSSCTGAAIPPPGSAATLLAELQGAPPPVRCDVAGFLLLGFSLAEWNVATCAVLASLCALGAWPGPRAVLPRLVGGR